MVVVSHTSTEGLVHNPQVINIPVYSSTEMYSSGKCISIKISCSGTHSNLKENY